MEEMQIPYQINKNLVRGIDYYTKTVFEILVQDLGDSEKEETEVKGSSSKQEAGDNEQENKEIKQPLALAGGGRYDYLAKRLGSRKEVPSVGSSIGVDRVILSGWSKKLSPRIIKKPKAYFIHLGTEAKLKSFNIIEILRSGKIPITQSISKDSIGAQLSVAEKLKVPYAIIFGQKEAMENSVIIRNMKDRSQKTVKIEKLLDYMKSLK